MSAFSKFLDDLLTENHLSASSLARQTGLSVSPISRWLNDLGKPDGESCLRIAAFFHKDPVAVLEVADRDEFANLVRELIPERRTRQLSEADLYRNEEHARLHRGLQAFLEARDSEYSGAFVHEIVGRALAALQESESRYRSLVELAPDSIVIHEDGVIVYCNKAMVLLCGAETKADVVGSRVQDLIRLEDWGQTRGHIKNLLETGTPLPLTRGHMVQSDGTVIKVQVTASRVGFKGKSAIQSILRRLPSATLAAGEFRSDD